jgi:DNA-binding NtrC family response regulator
MASIADGQKGGGMIMAKQLEILVVDDDVDNANSLAEIFEMEGHRVTTANSGKDAIRAYEAKNFDIAFMDIAMPGKNGVESFFEIRKFKPRARVYMMTGYSVETLVQKAIENGALGVLHKPVDLARVLSLLAA